MPTTASETSDAPVPDERRHLQARVRQQRHELRQLNRAIREQALFVTRAADKINALELENRALRQEAHRLDVLRRAVQSILTTT